MTGLNIQSFTPTSRFQGGVRLTFAESKQHPFSGSILGYGIELHAHSKNCGNCFEGEVAGNNPNRFPQDGNRLEQLKARLGTVRQLWASVGQCTNRAHSPSQRCYHVDLMQPLVSKIALKIRVSAVRFCPRPPKRESLSSSLLRLFYCSIRLICSLRSRQRPRWRAWQTPHARL